MNKNTHHKQAGFAHLMVVAVLLVAAAVGFTAYKVFGNTPSSQTQPVTAANAEDVALASPAKIKHLGVSIDYYNPETNRAGDFVFTKDRFAAGETMQSLFINYGNVLPGNSASGGRDKANPQPTFVLPLGTKVYSLVDGVVYDVPTLYSNDYSIQVQAEGSDLVFETEHVIKPLVKKGDTVKAGQEIAEVSDYTVNSFAGFGLVEMGILQPGNPPQHLCPFDYLDDSIKDDLLAKITALQKSWEEYRGDATIYDESKIAVPGCESRDPIEG